jgi:hypothetical protein
MNDRHEPTPEFLSHLEWQTRTTLSRRERFGRPSRPTAGRRLRLLAVVALSVLCGAAGVKATGEVRDARTRDYFLRQADLRVELAAMQLRLLDERAHEVGVRFADGVVDEETLLTARHEVEMARLELRHLQLDREEIAARGREPLQSLSAPLVGGRDFVSERLAVEIARTEGVIRLIEDRTARRRALVERGLLRADEVRAESLDGIAARGQLEMIRSRLELRRRFLTGDLAAAEVERLAIIDDSRRELEILAPALDLARQRLARSAELREQGLIPADEVRHAELELMHLEFEHRRARMALDHLQRETGPRH